MRPELSGWAAPPVRMKDGEEPYTHEETAAERYAFECGYLKGAIKWALAELEKGRLASAEMALRDALKETGEVK